MNAHAAPPTAFVRRVAQLCACSYADAERTIVDGGVRIDGAVVTDPAHEDAKQRRLARAVRTQQAPHLAGRNMQAHAAQGVGATEVLGQLLQPDHVTHQRIDPDS